MLQRSGRSRRFAPSDRRRPPILCDPENRLVAPRARRAEIAIYGTRRRRFRNLNSEPCFRRHLLLPVSRRYLLLPVSVSPFSLSLLFVFRSHQSARLAINRP